MQWYALHSGLHNGCILLKAPIYKGSEGLVCNNTIKKVKLFTDIKVKIIIENIVCVVCVVCCLHLSVLCRSGGPSGTPVPTEMAFRVKRGISKILHSIHLVCFFTKTIHKLLVSLFKLILVFITS